VSRFHTHALFPNLVTLPRCLRALRNSAPSRQQRDPKLPTTFEQLVDIMVDHDVELAADEAHLKTRR
jgi:hypothetical protein